TGVEIPRFCDHPLLEPVGACRQCIVEVEGAPKPVTSCTTPVAPGMVVRTQESSPVADKAQQGVMELLLINHPLDCPVCDKGGECPLQNQALASGHARSRFTEVKRTYPKPIALSSQVLLDRERCVLCARCTRFTEQIAGDEFIDLMERGALQQVGVYGNEPLESYFSGNTVQICPVGALTGTAYRFRARPFGLVSSPSVGEHCSSGCAGVLAGVRLPREDAYAYARCARTVLGTNDVDFRARPHSREEAEFLATRVAGRDGVTYADLETAPVVLLVGFDPEEESPIVFLRLRRAARDLGVRVVSVTPFASPAVVKTGGEWLPTVPGAEPRVLDALAAGDAPGAGGAAGEIATLLRSPGAVVLVGERLGGIPGGLPSAAALSDATGARLAWVPRRAGERGAVEAGCLPGLLPGG